MMRKPKFLFIIGLASLSIMACNLSGFTQLGFGAAPDQAEEGENIQMQTEPMPTIDPLITDKNCLAKTWEIDGLSDYIMAAIPPDLAKEYHLEYKDTQGMAYFRLSPDGQITLLADNLEIIFSASAFVFKVPVIIQIDGTASGTYDVNGTNLTITNVDTSGLAASAQAMGEDVVDPAQIINAIPFIQPPFNTATYSCQGDVLNLEFSNYPGDIPPLSFQAVK